ncbi:histamine H2 receptor-like [Acanthaster planci]|uniref:Histamine H2 receptor-like n=1 Tax=Acanthaster planci TaxID=133434 RepID=A0A8B7XJU8_ACAPL|nr:histamine H2 receptor-like [Acanthaster planci]
MTFLTTTTDGDVGDTELNAGWAVSEIENSMAVRAIYGIIAVLGIAGNFLVCLVLLRVPSLRSQTSNFLVHLALVDLVVCIWAVPFHLFPHAPDPSPGFWGDLKCRLYSSKFPLWTTAQVSICSLVTVNLERYIAIVHPIKYKNIYTPRNTAIMIGTCWAVGIITNSYTFYVYGNDEYGRCSFFGWPTKGFQVVLGLWNFTSYYLAPFAFMVLTQWKVIKTLKVQARTLKEKRERKVSTVRKSDNCKMWQVYAAQELEKTLLIVSVTYAICWAPNQFIFVVFNLSPDPSIVDFGSVYYHITVILAVANSCLNPIIYTMKNRPFRRGIRKVFSCRRLRPKTGSVDITPATGGSDNLRLGHGPGIIVLESTNDASQA